MSEPYADVQVARALDTADNPFSWLENMQTVREVAMGTVDEVMIAGHERYPDEKWLTQSPATHVAHALGHLTALVRGDEDEAHLHHALTRLAMAATLEQAGPR